jgi:hypothetical protein
MDHLQRARLAALADQDPRRLYSAREVSRFVDL